MRLEKKANLLSHSDKLPRRGGGKGVHEPGAVEFLHHAGIEDGDDAGVGLGADEAAYALAELEQGFGQGIVAEGIAAVGGDVLDAGFDQRVAG